MDAKEAIQILSNLDGAVKLAVEALEYTIPRPVDYEKSTDKYFCGNCGYEFRKSETSLCNYCPECGILLDWDIK